MISLKSRTLKIVSTAFMAFPLTYFVVAAVFFNLPGSRLLSIFLMPYFYFVSAWAVLAGFGLKDMKRWSWYVFAFANILIVVANGDLLLNTEDTNNPLFAFLIVSAIQFAIVYRVRQELRVPYFLPRIRWWESTVHYTPTPETTIVSPSGIQIKGEMMDLSVQGCFLKCHETLRIGEEIQVRFNIFGQSIEAAGLVAWCAESAVTHPKGLGIRFLLKDRKSRRRMKIASQRLKRVALLYRKARSDSTDGEMAKALKSLSLLSKDGKQEDLA